MNIELLGWLSVPPHSSRDVYWCKACDCSIRKKKESVHKHANSIMHRKYMESFKERVISQNVTNLSDCTQESIKIIDIDEKAMFSNADEEVIHSKDVCCNNGGAVQCNTLKRASTNNLQWTKAFSWLFVPPAGSKANCWCKTCECSIKRKKDNVYKHAKSNKHIGRSKACEISQQITNFSNHIPESIKIIDIDERVVCPDIDTERETFCSNTEEMVSLNADQNEASMHFNSAERVSRHNLRWTKASIGNPAPDWDAIAVVDEQFKRLKISDFRGQYVVFFFYPLDFTFVCPTEILAFSNKVEEFRALNVEVIACSVDSHFVHLAWIKTPRSVLILVNFSKNKTYQ